MKILITLALLLLPFSSFAKEATTSEIIDLIVSQGTMLGIDVDRAVNIFQCESGLDSKAHNKRENSRGLAQIHARSWPWITDKMAFDPYFSVAWSLNMMAEGRWGLWSCNRIINAKRVI